MSVDLYLEDDEDDDVASWNFTYNYGPMWQTAVKQSPHWAHRSRTVELDGLTGSESIPLLRHVLDTVNADPKKYRALEPKNGWGKLIYFVDGLEACLEAAEEYPEACWRACR